MKFLFTTGLVLVALTSTNHDSSADTYGSREYQRGVATKIAKGVKQIGADSSLLSSFVSENDQSSFRFNLRSALSMRYFMKDNLGISLRLGVIIGQNGDADDLAGTGSLWANYYARIGEGLFVSPGAGVGIVYGTRNTPLTGGIVARSTLAAGTLHAELPLVFFAGRKYSLKAGPEFVFTAGSSIPDEGESTGTVSIDGAFKIGFDYAF